MRAIDCMTPELAARSRHPRRLIVRVEDAGRAIEVLVARGWAISAVTRWREAGAERRSDRPGFIDGWHRIETWQAHVERCAADAGTLIETWEACWVEIDARGPTTHVDASREILERFYPDGARYHAVPAGAELVPVVAARMERSTHTFTAGQVVLVHDAFWGMNENAKVLGRYRRKHRWVRGVCPIDILVDCRPRLERSPAVLALLAGTSIPGGLFGGRFWPMPGEPDL
jgi:hypothetical protein